MLLAALIAEKRILNGSACLSGVFRSALSIAGDVKPALRLLNEELQKEEEPAARYKDWRQTVVNKMEEFPMWFPKRDDVIVPQWAIKVCCAFPWHFVSHVTDQQPLM